MQQVILARGDGWQRPPTAIAAKEPMSTREKAASFAEDGKAQPTSSPNWILSVIKAHRIPAYAL